MKKLVLIHVLWSLVLMGLMILLKHWFDVRMALILLSGAVVGSILPDIDHLIYIYLSKPDESYSQEISSLINQRKFSLALDRISFARQDRKNLLFHNVLFQLLFIVFAYLVVSSNTNLFGRGLVLAFSLHLSIDQLIDLVKVGNIDNWFSNVKISLRKEQQTFFWVVNLLIIFLFSFLF